MGNNIKYEIQVEKHVMGKMHQHKFTFYTEEISKYTLINIGMI